MAGLTLKMIRVQNNYSKAPHPLMNRKAAPPPHLHFLSPLNFTRPIFPTTLHSFLALDSLILRRDVSDKLASRSWCVDTNTVMPCFPFLFSWSRVSPPRGIPEVDEEVSLVHVKLYSFKELIKATDDFSPINKIGEGGFGSVYKGTLRDGKVAAIKVLASESKQGVKEFLTEINVISEINHENLVTLYGCCVEGSHRILLYKYYDNNSLSQTLLGEGHSSIYFNWQTRVNIAVGIARGLSYLHDEVKPYIVHRDIKASNIILDKDLTAVISDFGLAKLIPSDMTHVSTRVAGTIGYLAPEYAIKGQLTRKADIYSFGVLLLEIVSGRCNTNTRLPIGEHYLLERTWELHERRELVSVVDTTLNGLFDAEEACRFVKIGLLCTQDSPKLRPSMSSVVKMLIGAKRFDERIITKPGLISDFMDLKVRAPSTKKLEMKESNHLNTTSSDEGYDVTSSSGTATTATATTIFTAAYDRSI